MGQHKSKSIEFKENQTESGAIVVKTSKQKSHIKIMGPPNDDECRFNDPFFVIPKELIRVILGGLSQKELSQIAVVSRRWRAATYDPYLQNTFAVLIQRPEKMTDARLLGLVFNQSDRTAWDFKFCKQITNLSLTHLINNVLRIVKLDLSHCKSLTSDGMSELASALKTKKTLLELNISWIPNLNESCIIKLAESSPCLTHLTIRGSLPSNISFDSLFSKLPELLYINFEENYLPPEFFSAIAKHCTKLERLFTFPLTKSMPSEFYTSCTKLKALRFPCLNTNFTDHLKDIEEVYIHNVFGSRQHENTPFIEALAKTWGERLRVLDLSKSQYNFLVEDLVKYIPKCPNLTHLDISVTFIRYEPRDLQTILLSQTHLKFLGLRGIYDLKTKHKATMDTVVLNNPGVIIEQD